MKRLLSLLDTTRFAKSTAMVYDAFISYSHDTDSKLAPALQTWLQRLTKPWYKLRAMRVYRDETDLSANPEGWPTIRQALDNSTYLILLASPRAAQSKWVKREVRHWISAAPVDNIPVEQLDDPVEQLVPGRIRKLFIVLTEGEMVWQDTSARGTAGDFDWHKTTALPRMLAGVFDYEPIWVDLRWARCDVDLSRSLSRSNPDFLKAVARLASPIHQLDLNKLISEDYRQHRRTIRFAWSAVSFLVILTTLACWQYLVAEAARKNAEQQTRRYIAQLALERLRLGYPEEAMSLSLQALPRDPAVPTKPLLHEAFVPLYGAIQEYRLRAVLRKHEQPLRDVAFHPSGSILLTVSEDGTARLWDTYTGAELRVLIGHQDAIWSTAFSPQGDQIATGSRDGTARLWDTDTGTELEVLTGHEAGVLFVAFSPSGKQVVTASEDGTARIWDSSNGAELAVLHGHTEAVITATFAPSGNQVLTASADATARIWDAHSGAAIAVLRGHNKLLQMAVFSPSGHRLVTASMDGTARIWDANSHKELQILKGHTARIWQVVFSQSDDRVLKMS
jgi:MTH538 TIR-like domain (DUF1863)/WD domain, G-beta repeat